MKRDVERRKSMKIREKTVVIEAFQWKDKPHFPEGFEGLHAVALINSDGKLEIKTLTGLMTVDDGDWIIKAVTGEFYKCEPDVFEATFEVVE